MAQAIVDPEKIHLLGIRIIKEHLDCTDEFLEKAARVESFVFGHDYSQSLNEQLTELRARLFLRLKAVDQNEQDLGLEAEYGIEFHFEIENLKDFAEPPKNDFVKLKGALPATIAGIAYSTARGITWEKLSGTAFSHIVLPVINPTELLKKPG